MFKFEIFLKRQQILRVKIVYVTRSTFTTFDMSVKFIFSSIVIRTEITLKSCSVPTFFVFVKRSSVAMLIHSVRKKTFNIFCLLFYAFVNDVNRWCFLSQFSIKFQPGNIEAVKFFKNARWKFCNYVFFFLTSCFYKTQQFSFNSNTLKKKNVFV